MSRDRARSAPGACPIEQNLLADLDQVVRPGNGEHPGMMLAQVGFPEERVALLSPPSARRLPADDLEMEVRPAAAASFLAE